MISSRFEIKGYAKGYYCIYRSNLKSTFIFRRQRNVLFESHKDQYNIYIKKIDVLSM